MKNVSTRFTTQYSPYKSLVLYASSGRNKDYFIEAYDFSSNKKMINAHPLSMGECRELGRILSANEEEQGQCFTSSGILPSQVLYTTADKGGMAVWYTPSGIRELLFREQLGVVSQAYHLPALLWKATKSSLYIFALRSNKRPVNKTQVFKAPFFNIHETGQVCMGTVDIDLDEIGDLQGFIAGWENYFFNSQFSHLITEVSPVKGNIVQLYKSLGKQGSKFPADALLSFNKTIKNIIDENR